jgi:hypothetical protein
MRSAFVVIRFLSRPRYQLIGQDVSAFYLPFVYPLLNPSSAGRDFQLEAEPLLFFRSR